MDNMTISNVILLMVKAVAANAPLPEDLEKQLEDGLRVAEAQIAQQDAKQFARLVTLEVIRNLPITGAPNQYAEDVFQYVDSILRRLSREG
jgi:hypothetical protein